MTELLGRKPDIRWQATDTMIDKWLQERQELLILYHQLFETYLKPPFVWERETLKHFCEVLIDYISFGHFRVFEKLADVQAEYLIPESEISKKISFNILRTTLHALDFNDKYAELQIAEMQHNTDSRIAEQQMMSDLKKDLSELGEQLAHRLDWEDELIQHYHSLKRK